MLEKIALIVLIIVEQLPIFSAVRPKVVDFFKKHDLVREEKIEKRDVKTTKGLLFNLPDFPKKSSNFTEISLQAASYFAIDGATGKILAFKEENQKLKIASLTKIMTALVTLKNSKLDDVVMVSGLYPLPEDNMGIINGEQITVGNLLHGLLIGSANDASIALANHIASNSENFVSLMNQEVKNLGLTNTNFTNSTGFDYPDGNYSTAKDLAKLVRFALNNETFKEIIKKQNYEAKSTDNAFTHPISTTNQLLDNQLVFGVKTGKTNEAGECLISLAKQNENEIITIVLGSQDRFGETRALIDWTFNDYKWQ